MKPAWYTNARCVLDRTIIWSTTEHMSRHKLEECCKRPLVQLLGFRLGIITMVSFHLHHDMPWKEWNKARK
eukprot:5006004-Amphidinium_carterae.1